MPESSSRHILSEFDAALNSLRDNLLMMASLTQRNLDHARTGLLLRDEDHCNTAIADDEEIDLLETQIDFEGMRLLMRFQPLASDLRVVIASMKISVNLERLSDLAVNIARRARKLIALSRIPQTDQIDILFEDTAKMLADAVKAFALSNLSLAFPLKARAQSAIGKSHEFAAEMTHRMSFETGDNLQAYLELIYVARYLEQIASLCANISEDTVLAFSKNPAGPKDESE
jgi:phosphate transport system protein